VPEFYLFGGPNGAGKTTIARRVLPALGCREYVNADAIASALSPFQPESVALQAGYLLMKRLRGLAKEGVDFGTESTLAARAWVPFLNECRNLGYGINVVFVWLPDVELAVNRVEARVLSGGHNIPEDTVRRRYLYGLLNFHSLYRPLSDSWKIYDNSRAEPMIVAQGNKDETQVFDVERWNLTLEVLSNESI